MSAVGRGLKSRQQEPPIQLVECPVCKDHVPTVLFPSIRGESKCIRCQIDACRDYMEGTRRMLEALGDTSDIGKTINDLKIYAENTREMLRNLADKLRIPI